MVVNKVLYGGGVIIAGFRRDNCSLVIVFRASRGPKQGGDLTQELLSPRNTICNPNLNYVKNSPFLLCIKEWP